MIFVDDMKDLKIYKRDFWIPFDEDNKKQNALIYLLTPNYESSRKLINLPYMKNTKLFTSYYMEKNVALYIKEGSYEVIEDDEYIHGLNEERIEALLDLEEAKLTKEERQKLPNRYFGLPDDKQYPMPDESHVITAIRFFNKVGKDKEAELARNIIKRIKHFKMETEIHVGKGNRFYKYWSNSKVSNLTETEILLDELYDQYYNVMYESNSIDKFHNSLNTLMSCYPEDIETITKYLREDMNTSSEYCSDSPHFQEHNDFLKNILPDVIAESAEKSESYMETITDKPTQNGEIDPDTGIWNSLITINGKNYRERVEALIFNGDQLYIAPKGIKIRLPGGSTEPDKSFETQLQNECREESRINICNIKYADIQVDDYKNKEVPKWQRKLSFTYDGCITRIFTAEYYSNYDGEINDEDKDDDMLRYGRFVDVDTKVLKALGPIRARIVTNYLKKYKGKKAKGNINEVTMTSDKIDETYLNSAPWLRNYNEGTTTLYIGDNDKVYGSYYYSDNILKGIDINPDCNLLEMTELINKDISNMLMPNITEAELTNTPIHTIAALELYGWDITSSKDHIIHMEYNGEILNEASKSLGTTNAIIIDDKKRYLVYKNTINKKFDLPGITRVDGEDDFLALKNFIRNNLSIEIVDGRIINGEDEESHLYGISNWSWLQRGRNRAYHMSWVTEEELLETPYKSKSLKRFISILLSDKKHKLDPKKYVIKETDYYGYKTDILDLNNAFSKEKIGDAYKELKLPKPNKYTLSVFIYNDMNMIDHFDDDSVTLASRNLYESLSKSNNITYDVYVKSMLYAHCLYHIFGNIGTGFILPFAEYKAHAKYKISGGLLQKELKNINYKWDTTSTYNKFSISDKKAAIIRAYKGIEYEYGLENIYKIFKTGNTNTLLTYMARYGINESTSYDSTENIKNIDTIFNETRQYIRKQEPRPNMYLKEDFTLLNIKEDHISDGNHIILFEDEMNSTVQDNKLKQALYKDRIKKNTEIFNIYNRIKSDCPMIQYTFLDIPRYNKKNLFVDLSYYNEVYFKNNMYEARRGMELYATLLKRLVSDSRFKEQGYKKKTIFIPVLDWDIDPNTKMWLYKESINPISIIYEMMRKNPLKLKQIFGDCDILFCGKSNYFKINFMNEESRNDHRLFLRQLTRLRQAGTTNNAIADEDNETPKNSVKGITMDIVDKLEKSQNIQITRLNFTGQEEKISLEDLEKKKKGISSNTDSLVSNADKEIKAKEEIKKDKLVAAIAKSAENSADSEEALEKMNNDFIKDLIVDLGSSKEDNVNINAARASRIVQLNNDLLNKEIKGRKISEILADDEKKREKELKPVELNIATTNDDWKHLKFINFDKDYNQDRYIIMMLEAMSKYEYPISIVNIDAEDTSNSEDYIDTYTANLEDYKGKRFTIKFDVPKMINSRYLKLRGNKKNMNIQNFLMPIIKTDPNRVQLISNYNKILLERFGSTKGKSCLIADRIIKALNKLTTKNTKNIKGLKIVYGDNRKIAERYELPYDYIDLSSVFARIETEKLIFYFNQNEIYKLRDIDESKGLPYAIQKSNGTIKSSRDDSDVQYYIPHDKYDTFSYILNAFLMDNVPGYEDVFNSIKGSTKYSYSRASISDTKIPLIIVCCLLEGLTKILTRANIEFELMEKLDKGIRSDYTKDYIKFQDGYLVYKNTYDASLLLNGLKVCDTEGYSINGINSRQMYIDFLDDFSGRLKLDSLDNFKDLMIDPITLDVLKEYKLPTEYIDMLLYGNALLGDNKYVKHTHMIGRRMRRNELIPAYFYKALASAYWNYANENRHSRNNVILQMKKSAVIDAIMADPTFSDKSVLNALEDVEDSNSISTKGLSGMNCGESYTLDKRTYDESMLNIMAMSTGFAGNVGITRQATIDMSLQGDKGYVAPIHGDTSKMSDIKTLSMAEAITPFGCTSDDPFRTAMTFIQTAKHFVRTEKSDPCLITNGADEAMPYFCTDIFAHKAKGEGTIIELVPNNYMIVAYKNGTKEMINLETTIEKNSDGGFYVPLKLDTDLKKGSKVKENDILAYDKLSFNNNCGEDDNLAYNIGPLTKVAILNTDEGFNDSAIVTEKLTQECATDIIMPIEVMLTKDTDVFDMCKVGDHIEEGDRLLTIQNSYDDEDSNDLVKLLNTEDGDMDISDLGKITKKASVTGEITGLKIYRTCEIDEMSDTLKKIVTNYEKDIKAKKKIMDSYGIPTTELSPCYKLPATGKMKNKEDCVLIVIYQKFRDVLAVGDKIVYYSANKGVLKDIIPKGDEPITSFRPNEEISSLIGISSINGRMVTSTLKVAAANKLMVELDRTCKDLAGIPYDDSKI